MRDFFPFIGGSVLMVVGIISVVSLLILALIGVLHLAGVGLFRCS